MHRCHIVGTENNIPRFERIEVNEHVYITEKEREKQSELIGRKADFAMMQRKGFGIGLIQYDYIQYSYISIFGTQK